MIKQLWCCLALSISIVTQAEIISDWNLVGASGNEPFIEASTTTINVTGSRLTRGAGIMASNAGNTFSSRDWDEGTPDEYFSFGFGVESGYAIDLTNLVITLRSSNKGPDDLGLFYSGDGFAASLYEFDQPGINNNTQTIDLSSLQSLTGNLEFRIIALNGSAADGSTITQSGTLRITNSLVFHGQVAAVPEPSTPIMLMAGIVIVWLTTRHLSKQPVAL